MPRKKRITQADSAAATSMLDAEHAEPTHDPEVQIAPDLANARTLLLDAGWRVKPPLKGRTRQPRPDRVYASPEAVRVWLAGGVARLGSQAAVARALQLKVIGPVAAAVRGRPLSQEHFERLQGRLAEYVSTAPPAPVKSVKAVKAAKPKSAGTSPAVTGKGKRPSKAKASKRPAKNSGGMPRTVKPPVPTMHVAPTPRAEQPVQLAALVAPGK